MKGLRNGNNIEVGMKCKLIKGKDGFSFDKIYDVRFAGRVYWVTNDYGEVICDADESFEIIYD